MVLVVRKGKVTVRRILVVTVSYSLVVVTSTLLKEGSSKPDVQKTVGVVDRTYMEDVLSGFKEG